MGEEDIANLALRYVALRLKDGEIRQNYYFFADWNAGAKEITSKPVRNEPFVNYPEHPNNGKWYAMGCIMAVIGAIFRYCLQWKSR